MTKYIIIFLILLSASVGAQYPITIDGHTYADTIRITAGMLPYTATTNNRAYMLDADIGGLATASNGQILFNDCDTCALISEPGEKNTLTFTTNGGAWGVRVNSNSFGFKMRNVRMVHGWASTDVFTAPHPGLLSLSSDESKVDSCYFYTTGVIEGIPISGTRSSCIFVGGGAMFVDIVSDSLIQDIYNFQRRDLYSATTIFQTPSGDTLTIGDRTNYTLKVSNNYFESSWCGIVLNNSPSPNPKNGVLVVDTNVVVQKWKRDDLNETFRFGDGAFVVWHNIEKVFMSGNNITHVIDTTVTPKIRGGLGIFGGGLNNESLDSLPRSDISNNFIHSSLYDESDHITAFFSKWYGLENLDFHDNTLWTTAYNTDTNNGLATCVWLWNVQGMNFYDNELRLVNYHSATDGIAMLLRNHNANEQPIYSGNSIYSNDYHLDIYGQSEPTSNVEFHDFYFSRIDTVSNQSGGGIVNHVAISGAGQADSLYDIRIYNLRTDASLSDTGDFSWIGTTGDDNWFEFYRSIEILAVDSVGDSLNASVVIENNYGQEVYNSSLGVDGLDSLVAKYWRPTAGASDSSYNLFTSFAVVGTDTVFDTSAVGETDSAIVYLFGTVEVPDPPVAAFSGTPTSGETSLEVTFTDASTNTPTSWAWDFGDEATSTSQNPTHTYTTAGTYTVTLTATNAGGSDDEIKTDYITVTDPPEATVIRGKYGKVHNKKGKI